MANKGKLIFLNSNFDCDVKIIGSSGTFYARDEGVYELTFAAVTTVPPYYFGMTNVVITVEPDPPEEEEPEPEDYHDMNLYIE